MKYLFSELKTGGEFNYFSNETNPGTKTSVNVAAKLFRIAWNRGPEQTIILDGKTYIMPASCIVPLVHNQHYDFTIPNEITLWEFNREFYCVIDHDKEVSCAGFLFYGHQVPMLIKLDDKDQTRLVSLIKIFEDEFSEEDSIQGEMLRMLLKRLIILCTRKGKDQYLESDSTMGSEYDLIREFNLKLEDNFKNYHQVKDYAQMLNKSPKTLSNVFSQLNIETPLQLIQNRINLEARRLLIYTDKSVKEIAFELGFKDPAQFSKSFKKSAGTSPNSFRKATNEV